MPELIVGLALGILMGVLGVRLFDRARWILAQLQFEKTRQELLRRAAEEAAEYDRRMAMASMAADQPHRDNGS